MFKRNKNNQPNDNSSAVKKVAPVQKKSHNNKRKPSDTLMMVSAAGAGGTMMLFIIFYLLLGNKFMVGGERPDIQNDFKVKVEDSLPISNETYKAIIDHGNNCDESFPLGIPELGEKHPQKQDKAALLCYSKYAVHFDAITRTPLWSAEVLRKSDFEAAGGKKVARTNDFRPDPDFEKIAPDVSVKSEEYNNTPGIDRGHLAPAADFSYATKPMSESFIMTNIAPQSSEMNAGIWQNLEVATRRLMNNKNIDTLYITTGILYKRDEKANFGYEDGTLGSFKGIKVPTHFYKVILEPKSGSSVAYIIPNTPQVAKMPFNNFASKVSDFEKFSHINFHSALERNGVEKNIDIVNLMK